MLSDTVGPIPASLNAIARLHLLVSGNAKAVDAWRSDPITKHLLDALAEAAAGRAPVPGLPALDYAQAVGEISGWSKAVMAASDPESFLKRLGLGVGPATEQLPSPQYAAPEPPPATTGEKEE